MTNENHQNSWDTWAETEAKLSQLRAEAMAKREIAENLLPNGVPEGFEDGIDSDRRNDAKNCTKEGAFKKVYKTKNNAYLLGILRQGRTVKGINLNWQRYEEDINNTRNFLGEYPEHRPYCDLETKQIRMLIENFGTTLADNRKAIEQITQKHIAKFYLNLFELATEDMIPFDNKLENITFDETNGLRLIDVFYHNNYKTLYEGVATDLRFLIKKMVQSKKEQYTDIDRIFSAEYVDLTEDDKKQVKMFLASFV